MPRSGKSLIGFGGERHLSAGLGLLAALILSSLLPQPSLATWSPTGPLNVAREKHTATLLPNGKVLVTGG